MKSLSIEKSTKMKNNSIDAYKLFAAICVIAIHTCPLIECTNTFAIGIYEAIISTAVPFFFISTGFFLKKCCSQPSSQPAILIAYLKKIISLYLLWSLIYSPLAIIRYRQMGLSFFGGLKSYIKGLIFVGEHYNSWILWYLLSTIYALLIITFLIRRNISSQNIVLIGILAFGVSVGIDWLVRKGGAKT